MKLTVFTPTYNRSKLLVRTYQSLKRQTNKDFEWLIVDDGSTDDTQEVVNSFIEEKIIDIRYYYRENGGKMRAHNMGAELALAPLFLCLDSDDYLCDTAVEDMLGCYNRAVTNNPSENIGGVVAHKGQSATKLLGKDEFPVAEGNLSTLYGLYLQGFSGETTLMYKTSLLREFPFPEIEGEKYVPEDYIYDKIDEVCKLVVLPKIITICEIVESGYTDSVAKLKKSNVEAWYLYYEQRAYITPNSLLKCKYLGRYVIFAKRAGHKLSESTRIGIGLKVIGVLYGTFLKLIGKE